MSFERATRKERNNKIDCIYVHFKYFAGETNCVGLARPSPRVLNAVPSVFYLKLHQIT